MTGITINHTFLLEQFLVKVYSLRYRCMQNQFTVHILISLCTWLSQVAKLEALSYSFNIYKDPEPKPQSALKWGPTPGACVLWWLVSDSQPNCEFWSWLFNLLYISQVTFIIPFTDGNLKISDWVLSALICMAQICFYAPSISFFIQALDQSEVWGLVKSRRALVGGK